MSAIPLPEQPIPGMNPEVKNLWTDALRSGEYTQTRGQLRRTLQQDPETVISQHCCLGVLCELYLKDPNTKQHEAESVKVGLRYECMPLDIVRDWAGLNQMIPTILTNPGRFEGDEVSTSVENVLAKMNDEGATFPEIASWIEEVL